MLRFHPLANLFPLIEGAAFDEFVESVRAGLDDDGNLAAPWPPEQRIVLIDEGDGWQILDGRNRYRALIAAGGLPEWDDRPGYGVFDPFSYDFAAFFRRFDPDVDGDPLACVIRLNLTRRHLDEGQRAMVAARLATLRPGRPPLPALRREGGESAGGEGGETPIVADFAAAAEAAVDEENRANLRGLSRGEAAELLSVSERSVTDAKTVVEHGAPELADAVTRGDVAVSVAAELARLPVDEQRRIIEGADKRAISGAAKALRVERQAEKKARRETRERDLGAKQRALPDKRYGVIYADPEWRFEPFSRDSGMDRAADNHYPTSPLDEIKARPVADIAADDCVLFLWATAPMLPQALEVMAAWGFRYASNLVWKKPRLGTGYWARNRHEHVLIGVRGQPPAPAMGTQPGSVFEAFDDLPHSQKPETVHRLVECSWPSLPKIELNARRARPGWDTWGNEAPEGETAAEDTESRGETIAGRKPAGSSGSHPDLARGVGEAGSRAPAGRGGDDPRPSVTAEDLAEYKALWAISSGVGVSGPILDGLRAAGHVWPRDLVLTADGVARAQVLHERVRAASADDGGVRVAGKRDAESREVADVAAPAAEAPMPDEREDAPGRPGSETAVAGYRATSAYSVQMGAPVEGGYRRTPEGEPTVADLVAPGAIVTTSYGSGPYVVVRVSGPFFYDPDALGRTGRAQAGTGEGFPHYSLKMVRQRDFRAARPLAADSFINEVVAVGGRLLMLFEANGDEVFVQGHDAAAGGAIVAAARLREAVSIDGDDGQATARELEILAERAAGLDWRARGEDGEVAVVWWLADGTFGDRGEGAARAGLHLARRNGRVKVFAYADGRRTGLQVSTMPIAKVRAFLRAWGKAE